MTKNNNKLHYSFNDESLSFMLYIIQFVCPVLLKITIILLIAYPQF